MPAPSLLLLPPVPALAEVQPVARSLGQVELRQVLAVPACGHELLPCWLQGWPVSAHGLAFRASVYAERSVAPVLVCLSVE